MIDIGIYGINTDEFRRPAIEFLKYGRYIGAEKNSREYNNYWDEQEYYCKNGYSVGGIKITGEHYFYLNFCQIVLKRDVLGETTKSNKVKQTKLLTFPDFWDSDWYYFTECEAAKNEGQHVIVLKPRRRGYSFKNAAKTAYNYSFFRNSTSLIIAEQSGYAEETLLMAASYLDFLIKHTDFGKSRIVDKPRSHLESGFNEILPDGRRVISGYRSKILSLTSKNNPDVARGKDANVILFEEAGSFTNLKSTYLATLPTVQAGTGVSGQIFCYGTGGDFSGGIVDFEDMFYNPEPYNFRSFDNSWEEGMSGTKIGYFLPDYYSKDGFIDNNGNSKTKEALAFIEAEVERVKRTSKDSNTIDKVLSENPRKPSEAFIKSSSNIFPKAEIQSQINRIKSERALQFLGTTGRLVVNSANILEWQPTTDVKPILNFPVKKDVDGEGCIIVYQPPYKNGNETPPDLYFICHDPYATDNENGQSLGACFVLKRINNFSKPYDLIVAEYVARPKSQDEYNYNLFNLAKYYNAKIVFENDRGNVIEYARRTHQLGWLQEELDIFDKDGGLKGKLNRKYGYSMSNKELKRQCALYFRDWLLTEREKDINGNVELNLHKIYSIPLLDEILKFNYEGNFDRVLSLFGAMLYKQQLNLKAPPEQEDKYIYNDEFFNRFKFVNNQNLY